MLFSRRHFLAVALLLVSMSPAWAQSIRLSMPSENELNRQGLTLSWWGQAGVNPQRDHVEFFTADEQNVFVQSSSGIVSSFHAELGRKLWSQLVGIPEQESYPAATGDREVLITIGLHLYALNKDTGRISWVLLMPEYPSTSPAMDDKYVFAGSVDGGVFAFDREKVSALYRRGMLPQWTVRARMWNFQASGEIVSPPLPVGDKVLFAGERGVIYSLHSANKQLKFQMEMGNEIQTPIGYSKDRLLVADRNARLLCLNIESGRASWTFSGGNPILQQPRAVGNSVYVVPHREGLTSLTLSSGAVKWQQKVATSFIAASETRVYAGDDDGNLLILDQETGRITGTLNFRNFPIRVANDRTDRLFLTSATGTVVALREIGSDYPIYHLHPERRPILPEFAPEDEEATSEDSN